jgi:ribosomal protein L28
MDYQVVKDLISSAGGTFATVSFVKKDGTLRTMHIQPAVGKFHVKGDEASESAKKGVETRKVNNPNLMPIWDTDNKAFRSINLDTLKQVKVRGQVYNF